MTALDPPSAFDDVVARIEARVEERRRSGELPPGLEDSLEGLYRWVVARRPVRWDATRLTELLATVSSRVDFRANRIRYESGVPAGSALHRAVGKVVARQTHGILEQVSGFAGAVRDTLEELRLGLARHGHDGLEADVAALHERLATFTRAEAGGARAGDLLERIEALEEAQRRRELDPPFPLDRLRAIGALDPSEHREVLDRVTAIVRGHPPVVDLRCGAGHLVDLLQSDHLEVTGVDGDADCVREAKHRGLPVEHDDAWRWLLRRPSASLGAVTLIDAAEQLQAQELLDVLEAAFSRLRIGGVLVVVASDPGSTPAARRSLPTHRQPVHPDYLAFVLRELGFADVAPEDDLPGGRYLLTARR